MSNPEQPTVSDADQQIPNSTEAAPTEAAVVAGVGFLVLALTMNRPAIGPWTR